MAAVPVLGDLLKLFVRVRGQIDAVQEVNESAALIAAHLDIATAELKGFEPVWKARGVPPAAANLHRVLIDLHAFLAKHADRGKVARFVKTGATTRRIKALEKQLHGALSLLHLSVQRELLVQQAQQGDLLFVIHEAVAQSSTGASRSVSSGVSARLEARRQRYLEHQVDASHVQKGDLIASGGFGEIFMGASCRVCFLRVQRPDALHIPGTYLKSRIVIKEFFIPPIDVNDTSSLMAEVAVQVNLRFAHVLPLLGWTVLDGRPALLLPYMAGGSLD